ncbi:disease resistance protein RGA5-like [Phragmites australis]|uniref:disease resistance protein RGA5-like n=1 Tax=Phragmites australis TaxID=29695 RepID=UPI002D786E2A|nr:disease resistance protein RGA5-like [Phragmites australis]
MEPTIAASSPGLGAMLSIPGKLESLLSRPELGLHKEERNKLRVLVGDVQELMDKYLLEPSEVEVPAFTANCWVKEVRELSYDIDDFVDELVHARVVPRSKASRLQEKRRRRRRWIADEISGFRTRVKEAIQRYKRYLGSCEMRPARCSDGSPPPAPPPPAPLDGGEPCRLVGMNRSSMEELCGWLADDGQPGRKVVTIVGFGGVGKTTLAKELYRKFGWQFECMAFVRTSRKPDMRRLLTSIFLQVRRLRHQPPHALGPHDLVDEIKAYLKDKKYFIIIDDLWASSTWDIVNRALPKGNCCSRILTTTEVDFVAQTCCADNSKYIFRMEPLSEDESMELFFSRIFGHQSECPQHLKEVSYEIIKRSGGLPLAVISTASLLARQPTSVEQWNCIKNSLSCDLEGIEQVLSLGYNNLPHHLKACMLHLSLYEEDFIILKYDLANQWIDEGLICTMEGNDKEEVARSYFDELVNRGMIQPVDIGYNDEVLSCTVHYIILDFIKYKSIEENFITAIDHSQTAIRLADKVRRLSLHFGNAEDAATPANLRLQQVRTLAFFGLFNCKPSIVEFKLLQVLILQLSVDHDDINYDLTEISELFRLRYLYVNACHLHVNLPVQMQRLKDLATLKIEARVSAVPSDIVDLPSLRHLLLPSEAKLPHGIDHMTSLHTLGHFDLSSNSIDNMMDLRDLTNLQDLHLTCSTVQSNELRNNMKCLGSILAKLRNLKSLTLVPADSPHVSTRDDDDADDDDASSTSISFDGFSSVSSPPAVLRRFELSRRCCILPRLPEWTKELANLCILKIAVGELLRHDILGGLPALTALSLYIQTAPKERIIFGRAGFLVLRYFKFRCSVPWLKFEADAMPKLRKLKLGFNAHRFDQHGSKPISIERLSGLKEIYAKIWGAGADAESALTTVVNNDPSNPRINVQLVDRVRYGDASTRAMWNSKKNKVQGQ